MVGRAGRKSQSPYPSRAMAVNPAGVRRRLLDLPQEICAVSHGTEDIARWPDRGAEVSRGYSRPTRRPKARTVPRKGVEGSGKESGVSHDHDAAAIPVGTGLPEIRPR